MTTAVLPKDRVKFFSSESPAHTARLFEYRGGLYRAITKRQEPLVARLSREGILRSLVEQGYLVPTVETDLRVEGYASVLRHERVPFVTYPFEWPAAALRDAALKFINLNLELARHGLATCDAHAWNIVFSGGKPVFVDFGSIVSLGDVGADGLLAEFERSFAYPLRLMRAGQHRIARCLMRDYANPISEAEIRFMEGGAAPSKVKRSLAWRAVRGAAHGVARASALLHATSRRELSWTDRLRAAYDRVAAIELEPRETKWGDYYGAPASSPVADEAMLAKAERVRQALELLRPATVHDIAGNTGFFAKLAVERGCGVVVSDRDETCLDRLHSLAANTGDRLTPVYMDLRNPSPSYGWTCREYPNAADRLRADAAMALAIVHHLVFSQMSDFREIVGTLSQFTRRGLIVEFVSRDDRYVSQWMKPGFEWYRIENLRAELERRYEKVTELPAHAPGRSLLVCDGFRG